MPVSASLKILFLLLFKGYVCSEKECVKTSVTCDACIKSGPGCVWCQELNFTKPGELEAVRCDTKKELMKRGCQEKMMVSPPSTLNKNKDKPLSKGSKVNSPVQLQPQEITLELRPGEPYTFDIKFKRAEGYPVDLYYLMDLSYSMNDDLKNVKTLGIELLKKLTDITGNARIGFGSFVDKTVLPFTDTNADKLQKPCPPKKDEKCQPAFGYKHVLKLTNDGKIFETMVSQQYISGNLDTPEGGLDAIMQAATCVEQIGWGNSTRLLVLATDAGFHMAGDGKLAGILEPNQESCQMDQRNMYSKSNIWDYPSVGQIARKLEEQKIQPIFAVTQSVADVYQELSKLIPKSEVGILSDDSSNVVKLIVDAYNRLSSTVIMTTLDSLPDYISVSYKSNCKGGDMFSDKATCNNVQIGEEVTFTVTVKAEACIEKKTFHVGPLGFNEKLMVHVNTRCKCDCDNERNNNHEHCNKHGKIICGTCSCNTGYLGQRCECSLGQKDEAALKAQCRKDNGTECEGRGDCECGVCKCHLTEGGKYYGAHCECDDEHCEKFQNKLCGGNGECKCGACDCKAGFEGTACQCKKSNEACLTKSDSVCYGRGRCECNQCVCERGYKGPKCETCLTCVLPCQPSANCIACLGFNNGPFKKNCFESCSHLNATVEEKLLKSDCRVKDHEGCWMSFTMTEQDGFDKYFVKILKNRECPEGPNVIAIVGGSLAGVALIGLLILLLVKAIIYVKDLKEWRTFEKEQQRRKWADGNNPLFQKATTTVENPTFTGDS